MWREWAILWRHEKLIHLSLVGAILIGFVLAPIKDRYPSPASYFLFDILFALALFFWATTRVRRGRGLLPATPVTKILLIFFALCAMYALFPGIPLPIGLAAFRGWCFFSLAYLLGYDITRSGRHVRAYLLIVILLSVLAGLYGIYQYVAGIESAIPDDELAAERHRFATYVTPTGEVEFRIFSTFVSAGAFGSMMAYASALALILSLDREITPSVRFFLRLGIVPMMTSLVLTGTRAALVMVLIGLVLLWWHRRSVRVYLVAMVLLSLGMRVGIDLTEGRAAERFASLADVGLILGRVSNPLHAGFQALLDAPWGHGLGRTGHGVPFFMGRWYPTFHPIFADGDFGRILVEMGVIGLVMLALLLGTALRSAWRALQRLKGTPDEEIALAIVCGAFMVSAGTLVGSPLLSIPHGMLWWFFLGAVLKLADLERRRQRAWWHAWSEVLVPIEAADHAVSRTPARHPWNARRR
ncbi:MAG: O-antigen ligase family protein [Blastocatellia bacterium]|nr:O-antigen ligase family protein [Blastocatellia bacterium]MDW8167576.1 O-antigen ligase family protein [Acidobacteriota bacterium]MDW8256176.1 O-antigen ligase family protein [Acidobacteriota bacterium]